MEFLIVFWVFKECLIVKYGEEVVKGWIYVIIDCKCGVLK